MREAPIRARVHEPHAIRDFGIRFVTAVTMGFVLLVADILGGLYWWAIAVAFVAVMCASEFYIFMRTEHRKPNELFGIAAVAVMPLATAFYATQVPPGAGASSISQYGAVGLTAVTGGLVLAAMGWLVLFPQVTASDTTTTVFGAVYTGFTLSHLVLLRALDNGAAYVVVVLASVWAMDVLAYLIGSAFGKHQLAPRISPKKSWEGLIAGTVGVMVVWIVSWYLIRPGVMSWWWFALTGVVVSVAALFGDLTESRLKREAQVKDSGHLLPGHGGFLDRFDSLILVSLVVYYMLLFGGAR